MSDENESVRELETGAFVGEPQGVEPQGVEPEGVEPEGVEPEGVEPEGVEPQDTYTKGKRATYALMYGAKDKEPITERQLRDTGFTKLSTNIWSNKKVTLNYHDVLDKWFINGTLIEVKTMSDVLN